MDFEVISIEERNRSIIVEVEFEDRNRKKFSYPKGNGWAVEYDGVPKYLKDIEERLDKESRLKDMQEISSEQRRRVVNAKSRVVNGERVRENLE